MAFKKTKTETNKELNGKTSMSKQLNIYKCRLMNTEKSKQGRKNNILCAPCHLYICGLPQWLCLEYEMWFDPWVEKNGYLLQYSCLGNPRDRGAWRATVHRVCKESKQLKHACTLLYIITKETQFNPKWKEKGAEKKKAK